MHEGHLVGVEGGPALLPVETEQPPGAVTGAEDGPQLVVVVLRGEELAVAGAAEGLVVGGRAQRAHGDGLAGQVAVEQDVLHVELAVPERGALGAVDARGPAGRRAQQRGRVDPEPKGAVEVDRLAQLAGDGFEQLGAVPRLPARPLHRGRRPLDRHARGAHAGGYA